MTGHSLPDTTNSAESRLSRTSSTPSTSSKSVSTSNKSTSSSSSSINFLNKHTTTTMLSSKSGKRTTELVPNSRSWLSFTGLFADVDQLIPSASSNNQGGDVEKDVSREGSSYTSYYSSESSIPLTIKEEIMIYTNANDMEEEMSDIVDSVATSNSSSVTTANRKSRSSSSKCSGARTSSNNVSNSRRKRKKTLPRQPSVGSSTSLPNSLHRYMTSNTNSNMEPILEQLDENNTDEDSEQEYEAYLRAKMTGLWARIQESAQRDDMHLTNAPANNEEDETLIKAYEQKKETVLEMRHHFCELEQQQQQQQQQQKFENHLTKDAREGNEGRQDNIMTKSDEETNRGADLREPSGTVSDPLRSLLASIFHQ